MRPQLSSTKFRPCAADPLEPWSQKLPSRDGCFSSVLASYQGSMWIFFAFFISAVAYNRQQQFAQVLVNSTEGTELGRDRRSLVRSEIPGLSDPKSLIVRFSLLQPSNDTESLLNTQVPFLQNSLCWAEKNLASSLIASQHFGYPHYVVYTDNHTHSYAREIFRRFPWHRYDSWHPKSMEQ